MGRTSLKQGGFNIPQAIAVAGSGRNSRGCRDRSRFGSGNSHSRGRWHRGWGGRGWGCFAAAGGKYHPYYHVTQAAAEPKPFYHIIPSGCRRATTSNSPVITPGGLLHSSLYHLAARLNDLLIFVERNLYCPIFQRETKGICYS